jgi:hypothetical protein
MMWMRCSYGQAWTESGGCSGKVKLLAWEVQWGLHKPGNIAWIVPQKDDDLLRLVAQRSA